MKEFKLNPRMAVSVFVILLCLLLSSAYLEFQNRKNSVLELMSLMTENLTQTIRQAAVNSILSNDALEEELADRTLAALRIISKNIDQRMLSRDALEQMVLENQMVGLQIINSRGRLLRATLFAPPALPGENLLRDWLISDQPEISFGVQTDSLSTKSLYCIALRDPSGGAIIGYADAGQLLNLRREVGIGTVINSISENSAVTYIAIQDSLGILAATENVDALSAIATDNFLQSVIDSGSFQWRINSFQDKKVFEGILPFAVLEASYGVIRIGLDYKPILAIQSAAVRQGAVRLGILLVIGFLLAAFSIANQNIRWLKSEKEHITNEVYRLQDNLRRREKLSAMGELAAGVAHEIRNPLNAISMTVQRLAREFPPEEGVDEQAELIKIVRHEIDRISAIIRQFLEFARPAPLNKKPVMVEELIAKVVALYATRAAGQQVTIEWEKHPSLKANLDADKITQCLVNLLENALDAVSVGGTVKIRLKVPRRRYFSITVEDNGAGIPPENQSRIFNLYFTTKSNGTGLGLAQVFQIVSEHDGTIEVFSNPGQGTRFLITIPIGKE
ncbi:MAG: ATP-binding protein [Candidatus Neomarinimicrobiota bacterium]